MQKRHVELVSRGLVLRGYLELPEGASAEHPVPLLVMFHGFTGTLSEKHFLLSRLSRAVVAEGVATLRVDFGGSGESDGEFIDVTPLTEVIDGQAVVAYGCGLPEVDPRRVGLMGFSLGGFVAANVAAREQARLKALVLVSAATGTHKKMERSLVECGRALRGSLEVTQKFVDDGYALDPLAAARTFEKPAWLVQGTADAAVAPQTAEEYRAAFAHAELTYVEGADHAYDTPEHFAALREAVVKAVATL